MVTCWGATSCPLEGPAGAGTREQYATRYRPGRHSGRFSADHCHPGSRDTLAVVWHKLHGCPGSELAVTNSGPAPANGPGGLDQADWTSPD